MPHAYRLVGQHADMALALVVPLLVAPTATEECVRTHGLRIVAVNY
jgi:hypothetical protein